MRPIECVSNEAASNVLLACEIPAAQLLYSPVVAHALLWGIGQGLATVEQSPATGVWLVRYSAGERDGDVETVQQFAADYLTFAEAMRQVRNGAFGPVTDC